VTEVARRYRAAAGKLKPPPFAENMIVEGPMRACTLPPNPAG
jgi:hypothetical protein